MRLATLAFLLGILGCQSFSHLPHLPWLCLFIAVLLSAWIWPQLRLVFFVLLGFLWMGWRASLILAHSLPPSLEGQEVIVTGTIIGLPQHIIRQQKPYAWRFEFAPTELIVQNQSQPLPGILRLYWYQPTATLQPQQQWRFRVRLKRIHGLMNPGGFDYAGWLFQQRIRATGYVRSVVTQFPQPGFLASIDGLRFHLAQRLTATLTEPTTTALIQALALGDRSQLSTQQWRVLQRTGTAHLLAISGLHVGLVAALAFALAQWLWRLLPPLTLWLPAPQCAAGVCLCVACGYALLAGFSVPTQRALIMLAVVMLTLLWPRHVAISTILALALLFVLVLDPLATLNVGFWLSFTAVAFIVWVMTGRRKPLLSPLARWGLNFWRVQWTVTLGLLPLLLAFFGLIPLTAWLANLIAIPWISLVVVPLTLLGTVLIMFWSQGASLFLHSAATVLEALWVPLEYLANLEAGVWQPFTPPLWTILVAAMGLLILLLPRGLPGRWLGLLGLLPMIWLTRPQPQNAAVWLTVLEVGQGLAAVIQTEKHVLVYDTGPKFSEDFDMGKITLLPFLKYQGINKIDTLLISHGDNDHSGGAQSVLQQLPVTRIITSAPEQFTQPRVHTCQAGQQWRWDGVEFQILHPPRPFTVKKENNLSCVLKIHSPYGSILLPGDIERVVESYLLRHQAEHLTADILIMPHHGSKTSSSRAFIQAVNPKIALASIGYRNRFSFPHPQVIQRYREQGVLIWDTVNSGAIRIQLSANSTLKPQLARQQLRHFWHHKPKEE